MLHPLGVQERVQVVKVVDWCTGHEKLGAALKVDRSVLVHTETLQTFNEVFTHVICFSTRSSSSNSSSLLCFVSFGSLLLALVFGFSVNDVFPSGEL